MGCFAVTNKIPAAWIPLACHIENLAGSSIRRPLKKGRANTEVQALAFENTLPVQRAVYLAALPTG
jgi:hypothetical protein